MSVLSDLKDKMLDARKSGAKGEVAFLSFVIGSIERVGKDKGNRETSDDEAITVLKKMVKDNEKTMSHLSEDSGEFFMLSEENLILEMYIPNQASKEEVTNYVSSTFKEKPQKSEYMKAIKNKFGSNVDMRMVNMLYSELY